jgi:signal transduction histidine kinase
MDFYESLFHSSPYPSVIVDLDYNIIDGTNLFFEYIRSPRREALRTKLFLYMSKQEIHQLMKLFQEVLQSGEPQHFTVPLKNNNGKVIFLLHEFQFETDLKKALDRKNEFICVASHELKTPISALKLQVQMARRKMDLEGITSLSPEKLDKLIFNIDKDVNRLSRLVEDMLEAAKFSQQKFPLRPQYFHLNQFLKDLLERMAPGFENFYEVVSPLLETAIVVKWDRLRIEQVIVNLFTNAFRYGGGKPLAFESYHDSQFAYLRLKDQGPGISLENQKRIFNLFERGERAHSRNGLGLGLYICQEIVKRHGGEIALESSPGQGSTFTVKLPLTALDQENEEKGFTKGLSQSILSHL